MALQLAPPKWEFAHDDFDASDLAAVEALFAALQQRQLVSVTDLERWLRDESELHSRIGAELARRYIAMTCHTDDDEAKNAYLSMEQEVMPRVKVLADVLDKQLLACPLLAELDAGRYGVLVRRRRAQSEIFRTANTELQKQESALQTRQQEIMGSITVEFDGEQRTLQQLGPYFESQDRDLREQAFRTALDARRAHWPELEDIYDQLVVVRTQMGQNAGHATYTPFRFLELQRFDYTEQDCMQFHRAVAECVVPAVQQLNQQRAAKLGLERLRPWDLEVDPSGRPPLRPFQTEPELIALVRAIFARVDPRFADEFDVLVSRKLLDLMSRKGKAPGGYQYTLEDDRLPFVFANSVGLHGDVQTLLHEGGHAFHTILSRHQDLAAYRECWIEFAETASMSMELLGLENLDGSYEEEDRKVAYKKHLEGVLRVLPWIASIDAFQHAVYARPTMTRDERREVWRGLRQRFAPDVDWTGFEDALGMQWINQLHLFNHAFYYIEYGIAQVAALQVWRNYRQDAQAAVEAYRAALSLGGSKPLPDLFAAANVRFDLSPAMLKVLVDDVMAQLSA